MPGPAHTLLRRAFGHTEFRGEQAVIVEHVSQGNDTLVLMSIAWLGINGRLLCSAQYIAAASATGRKVYYWQLANVQHFDGFLVLPDYAARYWLLLPHLYAALDRASGHLDTGALALDAATHDVGSH